MALKGVKSGKAPDWDRKHPEFLLHSGKPAEKWQFYTDTLHGENFPHLLKMTKIVVILKPKKPSHQHQTYRLIILQTNGETHTQ